MKKIISLILALVMVMGLAVGASAKTVGIEGENKASITISNASKGVTYKVYKLFNATVTGEENGSISYTGEIPEKLNDYFTKDSAGNISLKEDASEKDLFDALATWAGSAEATAEAESDGSELSFVGLDYGYYVVTTTQGEAAITVTSTNPNAEIVDKNTTAVSNLKKEVNDDDVNFGDTVTYTVSFNTSNYQGAGEDATKITAYTITDNPPEFLSEVEVTEIKVDDDEITLQQFDDDNKITIAWVDEKGDSLYANGAVVTITYTATITESAAIAGAGNTNTVTLNWTGDTTGLTDTATVKTYAFALKKVDQAGEDLAGATFQLPFYVKKDTDGTYNYAGNEAGEGLVNTITTPDDGVIVVKGVATGNYSITETAAPAGYNKLTAAVNVTVEESDASKTEYTTYLNKDGNVVDEEAEEGATVEYTNEDLAATVVVVVNKTGSALPSTGGIGTTLFYVIGGLLMTGAAVLLITKKRMA